MNRSNIPVSRQPVPVTGAGVYHQATKLNLHDRSIPGYGYSHEADMYHQGGYTHDVSFGFNNHGADVQYIEVEKPVHIEKIIEKPFIKQIVIENPVVQDVIREVVVEAPYEVTIEQPIYIQTESHIDVDAGCRQLIAEIYGKLGCMLMENKRLRMKIAELEEELPIDMHEAEADILPHDKKLGL